MLCLTPGCWRGVLAALPADASFGATLQVILAVVSTVTIGGLLVTVPALAVALCRPPTIVMGIAVWLGWWAWDVFVYADGIVYGLYGYHINAMIWDIVLTPAAGDSLDIGDGTFWRGLIEVCLLGAGGAVAVWLCGRGIPTAGAVIWSSISAGQWELRY